MKIAVVLVWVKGEKSLLTVHGKEILPVHDLGGGVHNGLERPALPGQKPVRTLYPQIPHGIGILDDEGVHPALLKAVNGHHIGVEAHKKEIVRPVQYPNRLRRTHTGGFVEGHQNIDLRVGQQQGDGIGLGAGGVHQGGNYICDLGAAALRQGVRRPLDPLLAVGGALVVVDDPTHSGPSTLSRAARAAIWPAA